MIHSGTGASAPPWRTSRPPAGHQMIKPPRARPDRVHGACPQPPLRAKRNFIVVHIAAAACAFPRWRVFWLEAQTQKLRAFFCLLDPAGEPEFAALDIEGPAVIAVLVVLL